MSVLPTQSWITPNNPFFLLANVSTLTATNIEAQNINTNNFSTGSAFISSITGTEGGVNIDFAFISSLNSDGKIEATEFSSIFTYAQEGSVSTLRTQHIILDQATLDVINGNVLLLNGIPLATTSTSISSLQDWSFYPALQVVDMNGFNLSNAGNINSQNIFNALNVQSDTFSGLTSVTAPSGTFTNLRATGLSTNTLQVNTLNNGGNVTNWVSPLNVSSLSVSSFTTPLLSVPVLSAGGVSSLSVSTGTLTAGTINGLPYISGSNWSQYPANSAVTLAGNVINTSGNFNVNATSNANVITGGDIVIEANGGLNIASITDITLNAYNGNRGQVNITAGSGNNNGVGGTINLTADGGQVGGVGTGGTINLTANTPLGFSNLTSKISINASGVNSYAGSIPPLASVYGYNFLYGQLGVNICSGIPPVLPNVPGTTYLYGTLGVETSSDFYCPNIYPYWNGLTTPPDLFITGRYIVPNLAQVCVRMSNVRQIDFQSNVTTYMSNLDTLSMSSNGSISTSNLTATNATIGTLSNGNLIGTGNVSGYSSGTFTTLSNTNLIGSGTITGYTSITSPVGSFSNLNVSTLNSGIRVGTKSLVVTGDVAQLQCSNTAGLQGSLNLLMRQNYAEIQAFNSNFTTPLNLMMTADNFGFNVRPDLITGGIEMDISGNTQVRGDLFVTGSVNTSTIQGVYSINGTRQFVFGEFLTTQQIPLTGANTPTDMPFDTNPVGNGVALRGGAIEVAEAGLYEFNISIQFDKTGGGTSEVDFWVTINGNDVANTASQIVVAGTSGETLGNCSFFLSCNAGDLVGIRFASSDASVIAEYFPAWTTPTNPYDRPAVPSVIANIKLLK